MVKYYSIGLTLVSPEALAASDLAATGSADGESAANDWLEIVQPPWPEPPAQGFAGWLASTGKGLSLDTIQDYYAQYKSPCLDGGNLEVEIDVHLSRADLEYIISASYGELSQKFQEYGENNFSVSVEAETEYDLKRQVAGADQTSFGWEGSVIGEDLAQIEPPPKITLEGTKLTWGGVVATGTIRAKFGDSHDKYILTITPRKAADVDPNDPKSAYQSTVRAVYTGGGPVVHEVELPEMDGNCNAAGAGYAGGKESGDDGGCFDVLIKRKKCSGEILSKKLVPVKCPDADAE